MNRYHHPVLLDESINGLQINPEGVYVDVTFGGGGHSKAILNNLTTGRLIAFDQDQDALKNQINNDKRFQMINSNFRHLETELRKINILSINGLIADLGVSAYQFTDNGRGFSLQYDTILDMRMDKNSIKDARFVLNKYNQENLNRIFKEHADFFNPSSISSRIIQFRKKKVINTTFEFKSIFQNMVSVKNENKFFARLFQAVRIEVNDELNCLKELLIQAKNILSPSGRIVAIAYHSLEDVIVKRFMKFSSFSNDHQKDFFGNTSPAFKVITKKPITASDLELKLNNKSRSAKLRICEKI